MNNSTRLLRFTLALSLLAGLFLQGCIKDKSNKELTHARYSPEYMSEEAFEVAVAVLPARAVENPGKIYV